MPVRRLPPLRALEAFMRTVRLGSARAAAEEIGVGAGAILGGPFDVVGVLAAQGDGGGGSCCDAPPEAHAAPTWVSYLDDIARAYHRTFQTRAESDDF